MSTIKSSDEHLTLNADGASKDIKFQANGVEKASIDSSGNLTVSGNLTSLGIDDNADATAITIDSSENVAIGHTSTTGSKFAICDGADSQIQFFPEISTDTNLTQHYDPTASAYINAETRAASHSFKIGTTDAMTIDNSGDVFVGTGSSFANQTTRLEILSEGASSDALACKVQGTNERAISFYQTGYSSPRGHITVGTSSVAYNTSSDYRLKENVDYTWDATTRLKQLKPARFNFIADDTNTLVDGFIAHEVSSVVPEAISGEKDAVDSDGNIDPQAIDQSKLVPLLVKTIQELEARIAALEA